MKSTVRCFKAYYIESIMLEPARLVTSEDLVSPYIHSQVIYDERVIGGFTSFKIDTGRLFTGYSDNQRRTLEIALQYKTGGIPLSQLKSVENMKKEKYYE